MSTARRTTTRGETQASDAFVSGKDEMNLAEFPFASLRNRGDKRKALIYKGWVSDERGNRYEQEWVTQGGSLVGIPTEFDERVFIALVAITAQQGFVSQQVPLSLYQIINIMGLSRSKPSYEYVENSLERLLAATFTSRQAFWDHEREERVTTVKGFHLIDGYWLRYKEVNREIAEEEGVPGYIVWNDVIWKSFKAGYIKNLDLDFFYSLQSPVSRRLYRFLDKRMQYQDKYEIDVFDLGARLGLVRYNYPSKVIEKLQSGFDELTLRGFLEAAEAVKVKKYTRIRFTKGEGIRPLLEASTSPGVAQKEEENNSSGEPDPKAHLVAQLQEFGISRKVSERLANRYTEARITEKIEFLDFLQAIAPSAVKRPSGWLRRAIEEDYAAPEGFQTAAAREAAQAAKEEKRSWLHEQFFSESSPVMTQSWTQQVSELFSVSQELQSLSLALKVELELQMTRATYETHVSRLLVISHEPGCVTIAVPNHMSLSWLEGRLKPLFENTLSQLLSQRVSVNFSVPQIVL